MVNHSIYVVHSYLCIYWPNFSETLHSKDPDTAKEILLDAGRHNVDKVLDVLEDVIKEEKNKFDKKLNNIKPKVPQPDKPPAIQPHPDVSFIDFFKNFITS